MKDQTHKQTYGRRKSSLAFPFQPSSERGGFIAYMEESGAAELFSDVFTALYKEDDKPDNPLGWIQNYLRGKAGERKQILQAAIEQRRNGIMELAKELEQWKLEKERCVKILQDIHDKLGNKSSTKEIIDEAFIEDGGDSRWLIQPDPIYVGGWTKDELAFQLANPQKAEEAPPPVSDIENTLKNLAAAAGVELPRRSNEDMTGATQIPSIMVTGPGSGSAINNLEQQPSPTASEMFEGETEDQFNAVDLTELLEKSTETSPQPSVLRISQASILGLDDFKRDEASNKKVTVPRPPKNAAKTTLLKSKSLSKPDIAPKDEPVKNAFWKADFSLGKVEDDDDEESSEDEYRSSNDPLDSLKTKFQSKRARAFSLQEHDWLQFYVGRTRESLIPTDSDAVINDPLGTVTITTKVPKDKVKSRETSPPDTENQKKASDTKDKDIAYYQWAKTERGIIKLRPFRRDGAIKDNLQVYGYKKPDDKTEEEETDAD